MCVAAIAAAVYARSAVKSSEKQFLKINRPLLLVTPVRFANGEFLSVVANGREITYRNQYEIKNVGNVVAKNIQLGRARVRDSKSGKVLPAEVEMLANNVSLGPGDYHTLVSELSLSMTNATAATNYVTKFNEAQEVRMLLSYTHALDTGLTFRVMRRDQIGRNSVVTLGSDFTDPPP